MVYLDLLKGDCLKVMKDLSANTIDCFICDLPYGCLTNQKGESRGFERPSWERNPELIRPNRSGDAVKWDIKINLEEFWEQVKRLAKNEHTPIIMFATTKFGYELIKSNPTWFRYDLVWDKARGTSFLTANKMPLRSHEMIYVFSKSGAFYSRVDIKGDFKGWKAQEKKGHTQRGVPIGGEGNWKAAENNGTRCATSVISLKKVNHNKSTHPTEKPMELYKWLIERYCPLGGTVLDPTAGSFNSCFAAYELNRNAIGIEMDEDFYEKACKKADSL